MSIDRPVVLITGAAKRVGAQIARTLHGAGYDVALHYRHSRAEMDALVDELETARDGSTLTVAAELADLDAVSGIVEKCTARFGRLDAIVNNASAFFPTPIGEATAKQWDELFASNARAPFFLSQAAAPALKTSRGSIVNIVDIYAERALAKHPIYTMAKAALVAMTRSLARELAPDVRVNARCARCDPVAGKRNDIQQSGRSRRAHAARSARERRKKSRRAVLFLIRDATFTTGEILKVDGGRSLVV